MRIGIDGGCWSNRRGFGRVLREQLAALLQLDSSITYLLFLDAPADIPSFPNLTATIVRTSQTVKEAATSDGRRSASDLLHMGRAVSAEQLDLFFYPAVYSWFPLHRRIPNIVGIHDTIADRNPHLAFSTPMQELFWNLKVKGALWQADHIITVSNYSAHQISSFFEEPASGISVVPNAVSPFFHPVAVDNGQPYILYAGGISPNKNLPVLIEAFSHLNTKLKLILAGDYKGDGFKGCYTSLVQQIERLNLKHRIEFTGFITDERLRELYSGAAVFAMPSLDEGFGLPALEAMACGAPVVVSSGNGLAEVVGHAGLICPPMDIQSWVSALRQALSDPSLKSKSLKRAAEFSWQHSAQVLLQVFLKLNQNSQQSRLP